MFVSEKSCEPGRWYTFPTAWLFTLVGIREAWLTSYDELGTSIADNLHDWHSVNNPFGFTGYLSDEITGLYYAQAMYYEPHTSRMISDDTHWHPDNMIFGDKPVRLPGAALCPDIMAINQSANLYAYVTNNPLRYVDPSGFFTEGWNRFWSDGLTTTNSIPARAAARIVSGISSVDGVVSGISNVDWAQTLSNARDTTAGVAAGIVDIGISQVHGGLLTLAMVADYAIPFGNIYWGRGNASTRLANQIIAENNWPERSSAAIRQFFGVQDESLFYSSRIAANYAGIAVSALQATRGLINLFRGFTGVAASLGAIGSGAGAGAGAIGLVASAGHVLVGALEAGQGINSAISMARISGDNLRRLNELRGMDCDDGLGSDDDLLGVRTARGTEITRVSHHALKRMRERGITSEQIKEILTNPDSIYPGNRPNTTAYQRGGYRIVVGDDGVIISSIILGS